MSKEKFFRGLNYDNFSKITWKYFCAECKEKYSYQQKKCKCGNTYFIIGQDTFGFLN